MALPPLIGHAGLRARLAEAVAKGSLPQVFCSTGPAGVGKQRLALWLAQLVLCERPGWSPAGVPSLSIVEPLVPPGPALVCADPQIQGLGSGEAGRGSVPGNRTGHGGAAESAALPCRVEGMASHGIATVRLLQRRAALTPVEGGSRVFIIGEADRLVPQESSQEAANALLKLLEEPPPGSLFVLTTVDAGAAAAHDAVPGGAGAAGPADR